MTIDSESFGNLMFPFGEPKKAEKWDLVVVCF